MTPALSTISENASVLVVLGDSWVSGEIFTRLLLVRVTIASLKAINSITDCAAVFEF